MTKNVSKSTNLDENFLKSFDKLSFSEKRKKQRDPSILENELFAAKFDLPTPRPHLIILFNENSGGLDKKKMDIRDLDDVQLSLLFDLVRELMLKFKIDEDSTILSFHTGKWINTKNFHAHLCIQMDKYLEIFHLKNFNIEYFKPTREWTFTEAKYSQVKELYLASLENYEKKTSLRSLKFLKMDLKLIKETTNVPKENSGENTHNFSYEDNIFDLRYKLNEPKIEFLFKECYKIENKNATYIKLLKSIKEFASNRDFFTKNGSHICLNFSTENNFKPSGILRISADEMYKIHPFPELFFQVAEKNENYFINT